MAAITTSPGIGSAAWTATSRSVPRGAIPRAARRVPPTTYRRRRLAVALLAGVLVVVAARAGVALGGSPLTAPERRPASVPVAGGAGAAGGSSSSGRAEQGRVVVVQPGDTLWSIVTRLAPSEDPRPLVDQLSQARDGAPLEVGERIVIPISE